MSQLIYSKPLSYLLHKGLSAYNAERKEVSILRKKLVKGNAIPLQALRVPGG
jgi:hypothetical protein